MDRKGIIAVTLSMIILVWWQFDTQKKTAQYRKAQEEAAALATPPAGTPVGTPAASAPAAGGTAAGAQPAPEVRPTESDVPETKETITAASSEYTFTNLGGGIATIKLLEHKGVKEGENIVINQNANYPIGAILSQPGDPDREPYTITVKDGVVTAERTEANGLHITKTFTLPKEKKGAAEYSIGLEIAFTNRGAAAVEKLGYFVFTGGIEPLHAADYTYYTGVDWFRKGDTEFTDVTWFDRKTIPLTGIERAAAKPQYLESPGDISWAGVKNQYFTSLISSEKAQASGVWAERFPVKIDGKDLHGIEAALGFPGFKLNPGETTQQKLNVFAGPKEYRRLAELGQGEQEMMNFGFFKIICIFLLRSMNWLEAYIGSYAMAIIVLTFIVRGALWPVQGKATSSMKRMQALQPKMQELKDKYKDDPTKMNTELMKLYKDYGVNPFAGCLPMLIQIPIFFGFYSMLGSAVELRNSHFLWVNDLSQPDTVFHVAGFPINILPLLMAATMILQMQLTPKSGDPTQQRILMFMPLIFVVFTYNFASALALYYTVQNILSIIQLYVTRNQEPPVLTLKAAPAAATKKSKRR